MLLSGILRSAKPFSLVNSVSNKCILTSSPILSTVHHRRVSFAVKKSACCHYQKLFDNTEVAFPTLVRYISIMSMNKAKEEDINKANKKEVRKKAEKIVKDVDKSVDKLAKEANVEVPKVKEAADQIMQEKKEDPDYSKIYQFRHLINLSLLVVVPACLIGNSPATDYLFVMVIFLHNHFGFENLINDYISVYNFGETLPKVTQILSIFISIFILIGLVNVIQNDIGIAQTFHCLWKVGKKDIEDEIERVRKELEEAAKKIKK